jgi:amino acid adenylation domain-containing protein/non-ribosomal peptide synthase protein (TIGR01720 family)
MTATPPNSPADFARYTGRGYESRLAFWRARQAAIADPIRLGTDAPADGAGEHEAAFSSAAAAALDRIAGGAELGRFVVLLAALARVLAAEGDGRSILVDAPPLADAPHAGEPVPLVLPLLFQGTVRDLLTAVRDVVSDSYAHQDFPVRRLVPGAAPPAPILVTCPALHGVVASFVRRDASVALQPTGVRVRHRGGAAAAGALAARIDRALAAFADRDRALAAIELLSNDERTAALACGRGPDIAWPEATIWTLFRACALRHADRVALCDGGRTLTYGALLRQAEALAATLRRWHGVRPGALVGLATARRAEWIVGLLGILGTGGAYLPLGPDQPAARLAGVLAEAAPCLVLSATPGAPRIAGALPLPLAAVALPSPPTFGGRGKQDALPEAGGDAGPSDLAYVLYTSGSTGQPKGVMIAHGGFANMIRHQIAVFAITPADRVLQLAAASFDASLSEIFMALLAGAALVLIDEAAIADRARFTDHLEREGVTVATITPAHLAALDRHPLPTLRALIMAGDVAVPETARFYAADRAVFNAYGPTEVAVCASMHRVQPGAPQGAVPVGQAVANSRLYLLDRFGRPVPPGAAGEIVFAGPGVARGYLGRDSAAFMPDPFPPTPAGARAYRTGDLGRFRPDGALEFLGRIDQQVKIRGYRIEPAEIEQTLLRHPLVRAAHVAASEAPGGQAELVAWVALRDAPELWPSIAEFFVYDELAYGAMAGDERRNASYRAAFARRLPGRTVLEIGPGAEAVLSRIAIAAGARKVYAVEIAPAAAERARARLAAEGLADRVEVITGDIATAVLPEPADVCISEIVGSIGGSEGAAVLIEASRRWLRDPAAQIPARSLTRVAGVSLAGLDLAFPEAAAGYVARIFAQQGGPFDLRLCLKNPPAERIVTSADVLEDLDYRAALATQSCHDIRLAVTAPGRIDGFLAWLHLIVDAEHPEEAVDILQSTASWLPVYLPLAEPSPPLAPGDGVVATVVRRLSTNGLNPDFRIEGAFRRGAAVLGRFACDAPHVAPGFRQTPFYRDAFDAEGRPRRAAPPLAALRDFLAEALPGWMIPAHIVPVERMPLNASGKIDRKALPAPPRGDAAPEPPRDAHEAALAAMFAAVLGVARVGIRDDFFALGGDSIRAIQIAARLGAAGITLASADILEHRTVAALAPLARVRAAGAPRGPVAGVFPPTPIQAWFLTEFTEAPRHFNQALLLRAAERLDPLGVAAALDALAVHHDMLRARFAGGAMRAEIAAAEPPVVVEVLQADADTLPALCARVQASLDPGGGPIFRAAILRLADADRLLWVIHHLAVDWVSWRILLADLEQAYRQWQRGVPVALPPRTEPFTDWARAVERAAVAPELDSERAFWERLAAVETVLLSGGAGEDVAGDADTVVLAVPADVTAALLGAASHGTETLDLLLAGLACAVRQTAGPGTLLVLLEGHGREAALAPLDVSRTVGWFTSFYPVALDLGDVAAPGEQVRRVRDALRSVPRRGVGSLLLAGRADGIPQARAQIGFNYLGRLEVEPAPDRLFTPADEPAGPVVDPRTRRPVPIEILASVADGRLHVALTFNRRHFAAAAMRAFLDRYAAALADIAGSGAAQALPDLRLAGIGADELEAIMQDWG